MSLSLSAITSPASPSPFSPSTSTPSSSAVTIPTPGRSILKKPPPQTQGFFSRITKLLPTQTAQQQPGDEAKSLKRAHFILPELVTVYPISSVNPPSTPLLKDEKRSIELREAERRKRVTRGSSTGGGSEDDFWSMERVDVFYHECCASREEQPSLELSRAFRSASSVSPRTVDFSGIQLTPALAATLSDVLTIEWGLRRVTFRECDLDERVLKPILHALLIPNSLTFLSVASNRRLKTAAYRLIGAYVQKAKTLQFLDLSQNALDKKSVEYVAGALAQMPEQGLSSLKLDDCQLKPLSLEALAHLVRTSSLKNLSLRHNRINATGAVAVALMIRDYPDVVPGGPTPTNSNPSTPPMSPMPPSSPLPGSVPALPPPPPPTRTGPLPPPPKHPTTAPQTTYTPYIPRSKRAAAAAAPLTNPLSASGQHVPLITSSATGGVTTRHPVPPAHPSAQHNSNGAHPHHHGPSAALLDKVRALDNLPRLGALRTLDLRGNDLRTGVTYIAQVLKRNRTLRVLNLSENKLGIQELVAIADALKYNSCLETLDLTRNPCSGPGLEGIQSLRTAFTLNNALKRLFLSATGMTSAGAIALAEFLPESTSLLHLDLTENKLELAGVMALSQGLKSNHTMRCLDLNIPPTDEKMAQYVSPQSPIGCVDDMTCYRMCRAILETCIRNTEEAEKSAQSGISTPTTGRGQGKGLWTMIEDSSLARTIRKGDTKKVHIHSPVSPSHQSPPAPLDTMLTTEAPLSISAPQAGSDTVAQARQIVSELEGLLSKSAGSSSAPTSPVVGSEEHPELVLRARTIMKPLGGVISREEDPMKLEGLLALNDTLTSLVSQLNPRPHLSLQGLGMSIGQAMASPIIMAGPDGEILGQSSLSRTSTNGSTNGSSNGTSPIHSDSESDIEEELGTPRIDKGKGRAPPEPEVHEQVLSPEITTPNFSFITRKAVHEGPDGEPEADDEDVQESYEPSSHDISRYWVAEEGEVFRKGQKLLTEEEMEGDYAGDELRVELLEAEVERPPPRIMVDEFGQTIDGGDPLDVGPPPASAPAPEPEPPKSAPRPYISRRSSNASIRSQDSSNSVPASPATTKPPASPLLGGVPEEAVFNTPTSPTPGNGAFTRAYAPRRRTSSSSLSSER
ncbi:RNI-like protein [Peniophora sp. CONT]|nr:RNI-like protein [Peniophora sp. CONT]